MAFELCVACGEESGRALPLDHVATCALCGGITHTLNGKPCGYTQAELIDNMTFHPGRPVPGFRWARGAPTFACAACVLPDW